MERCPCCNARLSEAPSCPRCQADLGSVFGSEQLARHWFCKTLQFWLANDPQMAILVLTQAINIKQTPVVLAFRDFIIRQQCQNVIGFLENRKYTEAKESLSLLRDLHPHNKLLKQLYGFTKYLQAKSIINATQQTNGIFNELKFS